MDETYSILLAGLKAAEESLASLHFAESGHRIVTAKSIFDAVETLQSQRIDLIYFQPSADNKTVHEIGEIRERFPSLPIVLACARSAEGLVLEAWHAGATDILFLPPAPQSLDASLRRSARQLAARPPDPASPVQARFFFLDETGKECRVNVVPPRFTMGRSHGNDLILGELGVSRAHAEVLFRNGEYWMRDLNSKQGTFLNGVRVEQSKLVNGDKVQLGGLQGISLAFHTGDLLQSLLGDSDSKSEISLSVHGFREVGMLFAAFRALSSTPVLDDLLALVVDTAIELTGAERGFIMLKEKSGKLELPLRAQQSESARWMDRSSDAASAFPTMCFKPAAGCHQGSGIWTTSPKITAPRAAWIAQHFLRSSSAILPFTTPTTFPDRESGDYWSPLCGQSKVGAGSRIPGSMPWKPSRRKRRWPYTMPGSIKTPRTNAGWMSSWRSPARSSRRCCHSRTRIAVCPCLQPESSLPRGRRRLFRLLQTWMRAALVLRWGTSRERGCPRLCWLR